MLLYIALKPLRVPTHTKTGQGDRSTGREDDDGCGDDVVAVDASAVSDEDVANGSKATARTLVCREKEPISTNFAELHDFLAAADDAAVDDPVPDAVANDDGDSSATTLHIATVNAPPTANTSPAYNKNTCHTQAAKNKERLTALMQAGRLTGLGHVIHVHLFPLMMLGVFVEEENDAEDDEEDDEG